MLKSGVSLLTLLLFLPASLLIAQDAPTKADKDPAVDTITPVPAPKIPTMGTDATGFGIPKELKINNGGGTISGDPESGILFGGPVKVTGDNGLEIYSKTARLDLKAKKVILEGNISVYQDNVLQRGERVVYHYERKYLESTGLRASIDPILLESGKFRSVQENGKQVFIGENAGITTHDVEDPNYWIRANKTRIYPGEKIVFHNMKVYAGDTPVFWFPYLSQPLDSELGYHFIPGARTGWGAFLLNTYGVMLGGEKDPVTGDHQDAWLLSRWHFDLRSTRGVGVGLDLADTRGFRNDAFSGLGLYYLNDLDPTFSRNGITRTFSEEHRYSVEFKQRYHLDFADDADWRVDANLNYLSDRFYLEDLEQDVYRTNPAPDNTLGVYRRSDTSLLSAFTRFQLNDFYRADTRLPEIALDLPRAPLFNSPLLREGSYSFSVMGEQTDDLTRRNVIGPLSGLPPLHPDIAGLLNELSGYERELAQEMVSLPLVDPRRAAIRRQLEDAGYTRFRANEQISLPMMLGDFLSVTPQVGAGYTRYTSIDGPQDGFGRSHFHASTEASMKFSKDYGAIRNRSLGLNGLLHIYQPYARWSFISTDDSSIGDPGIDRITASTRPRSLDPARFTAVDQMQNWNVLRIGGRNRLITHRDNTSFEWLYMDSYIDAYFDAPESNRNASNLYNDLRWAPVPWMNVEIEAQFPIADGGSGFSEINSRTRFMPSDELEFSVGYRWLDGHPVLVDSARLDLQSYVHLTEDWGIGTRHWMELDDGTVEYQQYTMHRDLGNWVAGMGFTVRDNRLKDEYGIIFTLTLKDFPSVSLPFEFDQE